MKKRMLAALVALVMVIGLVPGRALAVPDETGPQVVGEVYDGYKTNLVYFHISVTDIYKLLKLKDVSVTAGTDIDSVTLVFSSSADKRDLVSSNPGDELTDFAYWHNTRGIQASNAKPSDIASLNIVHDGKTTVIPANELKLVADHPGSNATGLYHIQARDSFAKNIVAFYNQSNAGSGTSSVYRLYAIALVEPGNTVATADWPKDPAFISPQGFAGWSTAKSGGDPFNKSYVVNSDVEVYAQKYTSEQAGSLIYVDNTGNAFMERFVELYNLRGGVDPISLDDVDLSKIGIQVNGVNGEHTNRFYNPGLGSEYTGWTDGYVTYRVNNYNAETSQDENDQSSDYNKHIPFNEIQSITIFAELTVNGYPTTVQVEIPKGTEPGEFDAVVAGYDGGGGASDGTVWLKMNQGEPDDEPIIPPEPPVVVTKTLAEVVREGEEVEADAGAVLYDGDVVTWTITVTNNTGADVTYTVTDLMAYVNDSIGDKVSAGTPVMTCNGTVINQTDTGTLSDSGQITVEAGKTATITATATLKVGSETEGYTLTNEVTVTGGDGETSDDSSTSNPVGYTFKVTYNGNSGTAEGKDIKELLVRSESATATYRVEDNAFGFARDGYNFLGWYTAGTGGEEVTGEEQQLHGDATYFAHWEKANPDVDVTKALTRATRGAETVYDSVTGTLDDYKAQVGDVLSYTIIVTNTGNTTLENVTVTDSLWVEGTDLTITSGSTTITNKADGNGSYTPKGVEIAPNATLTITYTYTVTEADALKETISNSVDVYLDSTEPGGGEDPDEPDGEDHVTVEMDDYDIAIEPADIVIYTGGKGYDGVLKNESGELVSGSTHGLPEPGYHIELPDAVEAWLEEQGVDISQATHLDKILRFSYVQDAEKREWGMRYVGVYKLDEAGNPAQYVYSLNPAMVNGKETPVRVMYLDPETKEPIQDDKIDMSDIAASAEYTIAINPGELDRNQIKAVFTTQNGASITCNVEVGTGTLTVKSVTDPDKVQTSEIKTEAAPSADAPTAVAGDDVEFYVNNSQVQIGNEGENANRVQLLVDEVSDSQSFNQQLESSAMEQVANVVNDDPAAQSFYLDLVDTENGNAVVTPSGEVTIYWPMPADADPQGQFRIVHYADMDRTDPDMQESTPEVKEVFVISGYLTFTTDSFSPFVLVYEREDDNPPIIVPPVDPDPTPEPDPDLDYVPDGLNTEDHVAYLIGYGGDLVKPRADITRAEVATIFFRLLEDEVRQANWSTHNDFTDVSEGNWYNTAVSTLTGMGVLKGYLDGTFRPNEPITRAEFAAIAVRFYGYEAEYEPGTFTDVDEARWYADSIQAAVDMGLIQGHGGGIFAPEDPITRGETAAIVNRMLGRRPHEDHLLDEDEMNMWADNSRDAWYYEDIQEATNTHSYGWVVVKEESDEDYRTVEDWTAKLPDPDWAALERGWKAGR